MSQLVVNIFYKDKKLQTTQFLNESARKHHVQQIKLLLKEDSFKTVVFLFSSSDNANSFIEEIENNNHIRSITLNNTVKKFKLGALYPFA